MLRLILFLALIALPFLPRPALADMGARMVDATLRPGWRLPDGRHVAALHLQLAPGWKTYWRAPGDAGIPPVFDWRGARNVASVQVIWPTPKVFHQSGMRSVGYGGEVVLPLRLTLRDETRDARLGGVIDLGVCEDVCVPVRLRVSADLPAQATRPDPVIAAAMADRPLSGAEAGIGAVQCKVAPDARGLRLSVRVPLPAGHETMDLVVETADPQVWVAEPRTRVENGALVGWTKLRHADAPTFAIDRSGLRFTLLGDGLAVDIQGCTG